MFIIYLLAYKLLHIAKVVEVVEEVEVVEAVLGDIPCLLTFSPFSF